MQTKSCFSENLTKTTYTTGIGCTDLLPEMGRLRISGTNEEEDHQAALTDLNEYYCGSNEGADSQDENDLEYESSTSEKANEMFESGFIDE